MASSRPEPLEAFYDPANVVREGANPANIQTLFGGTGVINAIDGAAHASRKRFVSAALSRDAIETYVPTMTRFVDAAFARWTNAGEIAWNEELKRLMIETLGAVLASIESEADLAALVKRCEAIAAAFIAAAAPAAPHRVHQRRSAKDESIAYYAELVRAHRAARTTTASRDCSPRATRTARRSATPKRPASSTICSSRASSCSGSSPRRSCT